MGIISADILRSNMDMSQAAKRAMADWVQQLGEWRLFVTLTLAPPSGLSISGVPLTYDRRGRGWMLRSWARFIELGEGVLGSGLSYFAVMEKHKSGVPHMHALVGATRGECLPDDGALAELARQLKVVSNRDIGWTRCDVLVPEKGAEYYVCKYVVKSEDLWLYSE